jgi:DNA-binding CsgD family transcriptional regulator
MGALPRSGTRPTARELEILELVTRPGSCRKAAAIELGISPNTIHGLLRSLYARLDVSSEAQAVRVLRETVTQTGR